MKCIIFAVMLAAQLCAGFQLLAPPSIRQASATITRRHQPVAAADRFHRSTDLLCLGPSASAQDVVNVLGRWQSYRDWENQGELKQMDRLFDETGNFKAKRTAQQSSGLLAKKKGNGEWVQKTPERRGFCLKQGLVQRYWHAQNVGLLPFKSRPLAESVGASLGELSKRPLDPLAIDIVFDGVAQSKSGIIPRELCDARRASYEAADGGFDAAALSSDLFKARLKVLGSSLIFPGAPLAVQATLFFKLDGAAGAAEYLADAQTKIFGAPLF